MWQSSKAYPMAYCPPGRGIVVCHISEGVAPGYYLVVPSRHQSACGSYFTTDLTDRTDSVLWGKEEIKKFVAFPRLAPLQPDAYAQP